MLQHHYNVINRSVRAVCGVAANAIKAGAVAGLFALGAAAPAGAQTEAPTLKSFKNWTVHAPKNSPIKTCFAATGPIKGKTKTSQPIKSRGRAFLVVTNFPEQGVANQVAVTVGYPINAGQPITLKIDDKSFKMFADGEEAWLDASEKDAAAVAAMRAGAKAWVSASSRRGTRITDEFSLIGFTNAVKHASDLCK